MTAAAPMSAPERLARIIDLLCDALAARGVGGRLTASLLMLLWGRLRRAALRARRLGARLTAGRPQSPYRPSPPRPGRPAPPNLPRGFAWVVKLAPNTAVFGAQLQHLLTDPEMADLAKTAPMRRLLRPLCQMLGVPRPPIPRPAVTEPPSPPDPPPPRAPERPAASAPAASPHIPNPTAPNAPNVPCPKQSPRLGRHRRRRVPPQPVLAQEQQDGGGNENRTGRAHRDAEQHHPREPA